MKDDMWKIQEENVARKNEWKRKFNKKLREELDLALVTSYT